MRTVLCLICSLAALLCQAVSYGAEPVVKPGIEVLRDRGFVQLSGKRVGLVTNPSGIDSRLRSTVDILFEAPEVELVALFGLSTGCAAMCMPEVRFLMPWTR